MTGAAAEASAATLLDALVDGLVELVKDRQQHDDIIQTGHAPILVALMLQSHRGRQEKAVSAVCALCHGGEEAEQSRDALADAGAIPALTALLSHGPDSRATVDAASALGNLVFGSQGRAMTIQYAGAIPLLVALLDGRANSKATASSVYAISVLAREEDIRPTIARGGAIPSLVKLMAAGAASTVVEDAAVALRYLTSGSKACAIEILDELRSSDPQALLQFKRQQLHLPLQAIAVDALRSAECTADREGLRTAFDRAVAAGVDSSLLLAARARLQATAAAPEMAKAGGSALGGDIANEASSSKAHSDARPRGRSRESMSSLFGRVDRMLWEAMPAALNHLGGTMRLHFTPRLHL